MDRFDERPLDRPGYEPPAPSPSRAKALAITVVAGIVILGAGLWLWRRPATPTPHSPIAPPRPAADAAAARATPAQPPLPRLDASDDFVRDLLAALSNRPELARWLAAGESLARAGVGATIRLGEGNAPRASIPFWSPEGTFAVIARDGRTYVDPRTYERYSALVEVFASLDAEQLAAAIRRAEPLLDEAVAEVSLPGRTFSDALAGALAELRRTPLPAEGEELEVNGAAGLYRYADPALENLSAAQKQLLRFGPRNARRVLAKLDALERALRPT